MMVKPTKPYRSCFCCSAGYCRYGIERESQRERNRTGGERGGDTAKDSVSAARSKELGCNYNNMQNK